MVLYTFGLNKYDDILWKRSIRVQFKNGIYSREAKLTNSFFMQDFCFQLLDLNFQKITLSKLILKIKTLKWWTYHVHIIFIILNKITTLSLNFSDFVFPIGFLTLLFSFLKVFLSFSFLVVVRHGRRQKDSDVSKHFTHNYIFILLSSFPFTFQYCHKEEC